MRICALLCLLFFANIEASGQNPPALELPADVIRQVMARQDRFVLLSGRRLDPHKSVMVMLHGATEDPTEMMEIFRRWEWKYNVFLYSYNYHLPIERIAADFVREWVNLRAATKSDGIESSPLRDITVITYSYSAAVFRKAVLSGGTSLFEAVSLIQLTPTPGGSYMARGMSFPGLGFLVGLFSKPSAVEDPHGKIAEQLWGSEANARFYQTIPPRHVHSILIEADPHSLARIRDKTVQMRYLNGIGANVVIIPKTTGTSHDFFPTEPATLNCLKILLETSPPGNGSISFRSAKSGG